MALVEDKEGGRIKSIKNGKYGVEVDLLPADNALTNMARIHGLFVDKSIVDNQVTMVKPLVMLFKFFCFFDVAEVSTLRTHFKSLLVFQNLVTLRNEKRQTRSILFSHGKINFILAIKITVPKTIFNVLLEKDPLP